MQGRGQVRLHGGRLRAHQANVRRVEERVSCGCREWMIDHLEVESTVLHKESEEGKAQMMREGANKMGEQDGG